MMEHSKSLAPHTGKVFKIISQFAIVTTIVFRYTYRQPI